MDHDVWSCQERGNGGRPKSRFYGCGVKEYMAEVEVTEEDTEVGTTGDGKSACGDL